MFLILLALAPDLDRHVHDDHVDDDPDPNERDDQAYVLAEGWA
jgi:hypothetical protein